MRRGAGRLWGRYLAVRGSLAEGIPREAERRSAQREARVLRGRLVSRYLPLVRYVAGRVSGPAAPGAGALEYEEVLSCGVEGLLHAVETYDPARGTKFESYAISKIRWSILDELRKADPLSRRLRALASTVEGARAALAQRYRRSPTEAEVAREIGVGLPEHRAFLERCRRVHPCSLEARVGSEGPLYGELVADPAAVDPAEAAVEAAAAAEARARLCRALGRLGERERLVATRYYYEGLTLREIGESMGLTEGRISQLLRRALGELREELSGGEVPGAPARSLDTLVLTSPGPEKR